MPLHIPLHDFSKDDKDSIPFRFIPLNATSDYNIAEAHRHNYYEIFFFETGGGIHIIDFEQIPIRDNSIHFVSPGQVHLLNREKGSLGDIIMFSRDFYYISASQQASLYDFPFLNNSHVQPAIALSKEEHDQFAFILKLLQSELNNNEQNASVLGHYLQIILLKCLNLYKGDDKKHVTKGSSTFQEVRMLLEQHYRSERQPAAYASMLHITEKKLNDICKENTGLNIGELIKSRVLLEAKRLLSNSDHNIKEIAYFLGFEDPSYFNRFFRINTGQTAGEYRKGK